MTDKSLLKTLYDILTEQVDDIKRVNTDRWNARSSTFEIAGGTGSGRANKEKADWEHDKGKMLSAIGDLNKLPTSYDGVNLKNLSQHHRALRNIQRVFQYERSMLAAWSDDEDRVWNRSIDIRRGS